MMVSPSSQPRMLRTDVNQSRKYGPLSSSRVPFCVAIRKVCCIVRNVSDCLKAGCQSNVLEALPLSELPPDCGSILSCPAAGFAVTDNIRIAVAAYKREFIPRGLIGMLLFTGYRAGSCKLHNSGSPYRVAVCGNRSRLLC